jgi:Icc-related predicted phosphoesterase
MQPKLKVVCISDTHNYHDQLSLPAGDILIHSGDFTGKGTVNEIEDFNRWLGSIKYKYRYIIVVAGNHDFLFDQDEEQARSLLTNCIYLQDESVEIEGRQIYGSPWQPSFLKWAFNLERDSKELRDKWKRIPFHLDLLITHCPPKGFCDTLNKETITDDPTGRPIVGKVIVHMGCDDLYSEVLIKKPKNHVFGHIHDGYGSFNTGDTLFVNAATCTEKYYATNAPIVIYI